MEEPGEAGAEEEGNSKHKAVGRAGLSHVHLPSLPPSGIWTFLGPFSACPSCQHRTDLQISHSLIFVYFMIFLIEIQLTHDVMSVPGGPAVCSGARSYSLILAGLKHGLNRCLYFCAFTEK